MIVVDQNILIFVLNINVVLTVVNFAIGYAAICHSVAKHNAEISIINAYTVDYDVAIHTGIPRAQLLGPFPS